MGSYQSWSVVFGEQPSAAKWNILGTNDSAFNDGSGIGDGVIASRQLATGVPVQFVGNVTSAVSTGTTLIPEDDTKPQNTEGDQYLSQAITPKSATNRLFIRAVLQISQSTTNNDAIAALFQDSTVDALAGKDITFPSASGAISQLVVEHDMLAGTTSATTIKLRAGLVLAGTLTVNGNGGARKFGGISLSSLSIMEYKV